MGGARRCGINPSPAPATIAAVDYDIEAISTQFDPAPTVSRSPTSAVDDRAGAFRQCSAPLPPASYALAAVRAAANTSRADVVPATCSAPSTPRSHPTRVHRLEHFFGRSGAALRDTELLERFRPFPHAGLRKGNLHLEIQDFTQLLRHFIRGDHQNQVRPRAAPTTPARSKGLRPPHRCRSSRPWSISGLSDCKYTGSVPPRATCKPHTGSFRRIHPRARMRSAISGRENLAPEATMP